MRDRIFVIIIFVIFLTLPIAVFVREEKDISTTENRSLFKKSDIRLSNLNDDLQRYFQDQFLYGERLKNIYNTGKNKVIKISMNIIEYSNIMDRIPMGSDLFRLSGSDYIVYNPANFNESCGVYLDIIKSINDLSENNLDKQFYVYNIVTDDTIDNKSDYDELLRENLNSNIKYMSSTKINTYDDYKKSFYKTDHHWNKDGQYDGYADIIGLIGDEINITPKGIKKFDGIKFLGSKARTLGNNDIYDDFEVYEYVYPEMEVKINSKEVEDYGDAKAFYNENIKSSDIYQNYYADFYGSDYGIIEFNVDDNADKSNILIISNSYSNPINKLIASSFHNTYVVDLRWYNQQNCEEFDANEFIKENDIDKILILGNYKYFTNSKFKIQ